MAHLQLSLLDWLRRCDVRPQGADVLMCWEMELLEILFHNWALSAWALMTFFFLTLKILCRDNSYAVAPGTNNPLESSIA